MLDSHARSAAAFVIPLAVVLIASCTERYDAHNAPVEIAPTAPRISRGVRAQNAFTLDEKFARIDSTVSGFGGFFVDERGTPVVWLRENTDRPSVIAALRAEFTELPDLARLEVRQATHDYSDLMKWRALIPLTPVVDRARIRFVDVDERTNRLALGVREDVDIGPVSAALLRLGVPPEALQIFRFSPATNGRPGLSLSDTINPIVGGVRVFNPAAGSCSAGFAVDLDYVAYVATASHCSSTKGLVDSDTIFQPTHTYGGLGSISASALRL